MGEGMVKRTCMLDRGWICFVEMLVKLEDPSVTKCRREQNEEVQWGIV